MTPPFERTTCACEACVRCCREQPGPLIPGDLERIAAHVGVGADVLAQLFVASPGATVLDRRTGRLRTVGTIVPRADGTGRCVFLAADDHCQIHAVAPAGCAYFDPHMDTDEAQRRAAWVVRAQEDVAYQARRATLERAATGRRVMEVTAWR